MTAANKGPARWRDLPPPPPFLAAICPSVRWLENQYVPVAAVAASSIALSGTLMSYALEAELALGMVVAVVCSSI